MNFIQNLINCDVGRCVIFFAKRKKTKTKSILTFKMFLYLYLCVFRIYKYISHPFQPNCHANQIFSSSRLETSKTRKLQERGFQRTSNLNDFSALFQIIWTRHFPQHLKVAVFLNSTRRMIKPSSKIIIFCIKKIKWIKSEPINRLWLGSTAKTETNLGRICSFIQNCWFLKFNFKNSSSHSY